MKNGNVPVSGCALFSTTRGSFDVHNSVSYKNIRQSDDVLSSSCNIPPCLTIERYLLGGKKRARDENLNARDTVLENMDCSPSRIHFPKVEYRRLPDFPGATDLFHHKDEEKKKNFDLCQLFLHIREVCSEDWCGN